MNNLIHNIGDRKIVHIGIVGCGPKGLYGFERLAACLQKNPPRVSVIIDIYNRSSYFGAGDVYHPEQDSYLLINNPVGDINMWAEENPPPVVSDPLTCVEWLQKKGENVNGHDYVSRAKVGQYLNDGFQSIADNLPHNVSANYHIGEVTDIKKSNNRYKLTYKPKDPWSKKLRLYDHILLATGHPKHQSSKQDRFYFEKTSDFKIGNFIPFIYPVRENLAGVEPDSSIGIKGLGLTFIDAVLALTEGRNGKFCTLQNDRFEYEPSGKEPSKIFSFSRRGIPMIPRNSIFEDTELKFFSRENIKGIYDHSTHSKVDFTTQLLPLLKQEMIYTFYRIQLKRSGFERDLLSCSSFKEVESLIKCFHQEYPETEHFDYDSFLNPLKDSEFKNSDQLNSFIYNYQLFYYKEALKGEQKSGWAGASSVWRKVTPFFNDIYSFGGLLPESQRKFDNSYRSKLNRVTFGPPVETVRKLIALQEAGILDYGLSINPTVSLNEKTESFTIFCPKTDTRRSVDYLVDARIPKVSVRENSSLYQNLHNRGLISIFDNKLEDQSYKPGCSAISKEGYAINSNGSIEHGILMTGTPTEGITFDNDTLSRNRNNFVSEWAKSISHLYKKRSLSHEIS